MMKLIFELKKIEPFYKQKYKNMLRSTDIQKQLEHGRILLKMTSCASFDSILVLSLREL